MVREVKKRIHTLRKSASYTLTSAEIQLSYAAGRLFFGRPSSGSRTCVSNLGVIHIGKEREGDVHIVLPETYTTYVDMLSQHAAERMSLTAHCIIRSADKSLDKRLEDVHLLPQRTFDIKEIAERRIGNIVLQHTLDLPGLKEIVDILLPQIEEKVYGSPLFVEVATVYRNMESILPEHASILWHSDNHFEGVMKVMVYLTDVGERNAPFEYLRHKETLEPIHISPAFIRKYPSGRVPKDVINGYLMNGYESVRVTGRKGTTLLFDDKIIHKGNYAKEGYRDVLVLQFRPCMSRRAYVHPSYTVCH